MSNLLLIVCFIAAMFLTVLDFPNSAVGVLVTALCSAMVIILIRRFFTEESEYLSNIFLIALLARLFLGAIIHTFELRDYFGGDANTYDAFGNTISEIWFSPDLSDTSYFLKDSGWGMNYLVAVMYSLIGRNIYAAQCFCAVFGAATAPLVYNCAYQIFGNRQVGKISAALVALYPAFIIWSSQLIKDGLIIFLLILSITLVLQLQKKFSYGSIIILILALLGILSLRFYIFYMVAVAVVGTFVIGSSNSLQSFIRRAVVLVVIGLGMTYVGVVRNAEKDIDTYANLERLQVSRNDLSKAGSGFGNDTDVSTTSGAIAALPIGFIYLILAPLPWQINSFSQAMILPDVMIWWAMLPLIISGLLYSVKHRLRASLVILMFSLMLTLAYSLFQGNVGMAYRQRTQIQVFLFMFAAVGWTLIQERRENKKVLHQAKRTARLKEARAQVKI